ncbi:porin [Paraburkholderia dipogonis]|uniref:Porin n=1 Tax=Paraburkholderia dipogonis TaxID=1211383 RepID=A0A4Y8MWI7_9BURK|nr:porin [Paraburkholderia dipogonis]TFE41906.1 porin [Paraburkholderia dipogonis]
MKLNHRIGAGVVAGILSSGAGTLAHAQSSVTLYGIVDTAILYTSKTSNMATGNNSGHQFSMITGGVIPSFFGFKGTEDLGGGWKAIFALESGYSGADGALANSNGNFFGRQAWVGASGAFGTFKAGLQESPFVHSLILLDPRDASYFGSGAPIVIGDVLATSVYNSNAISYTSPTLAGLQGSVMFAFGGAAGDFQAGRQYSASVEYRNGPFLVGASMYSGNSGGTAASTPVPSTVPFVGRAIGGSYHLSNLTLRVLFFSTKVAGKFDSRTYSGGFSYLMTPATNVDAGVYYTSDGNDTRNHSIMAATGLTYYLSKATSLYTQFGYVDNHGRMNTGLSLNGALYGVSGSTFGANVGIRHIF